MAINEKTYNTIQAYLNDELRPEERKHFQEAIDEDPALAEEVRLHADLQKMLQDSPENSLRRQLQKLSDQSPNPVNSTPRSKSLLHLLWLIPLLLFGLWWFMPSGIPQQESVEPIPNEESVESKAEQSSSSPGVQNTNKPDVESPITPPVSPSEKKDPLPKSSPSATEVENPPQPIAANFEPNPALEFMIGNNVRSNDVSFKMLKQLGDIQLTTKDEPINFQLLAELISTSDLQGTDFKLHLFDNNSTSFENFEPLMSFDLELTALSNQGGYQVQLEKNIQLEPGLYYQVLEDFAEERIFWVDKFMVTNEN